MPGQRQGQTGCKRRRKVPAWLAARNWKVSSSMNSSELKWSELLDRWERRALRWACSEIETYGIADPRQRLDVVLRDEAARLGVRLPPETFRPLGPVGSTFQGAEDAELRARLSRARDLVREIERVLEHEQRPLRERLGGYLWAVLRNGGLRFAPATEDALQTLESRLGRALPPSYQQFLRVSNGWLTFWARLLPASEVAPLASRDPELIAEWGEDVGEIADEEYDVYGSEQNAALYRREYLAHTIEISEPIGSWCTYLLCPCRTFPDGEWETWRMSVALAGAQRFRSFRDFMHDLEQRELTELT